MSGTAPISSSGGATPTISITKADSTHDGYLSSTDWGTFNGKEGSLAAGTTSQYYKGDKSWSSRLPM